MSTDRHVVTPGRKLDFRATGQVIRFPGFLKLYREDTDDKQPADGEDDDEVDLASRAYQMVPPPDRPISVHLGSPAVVTLDPDV